jgi:putative ABC transport system substrate-binding protein
MYRQAAKLLAKVMRGAPTADMPAEQPTKFELIINLKTAKELNLAVPTALLVAADEVIE